jgi:ornithine cyclodeaminase
MPAAAGDAAGVKLVGIQPANPKRGLPIIQGVYVLFDMRIGQPVALLDGAALTTLRTPMISALATDALARDDVRSLGIIGTGPQAVAHVHAMRVVRPDIEDVVVAGRTAAHVDRVVDELEAGGETVHAGSYADAAACDVVCAATRADAALFGLAEVSPGAHLNLVGSYRLDLREVAADLVAASTVAVDDVASAKAEAGDLHLAVQEGVWTWDKVAGDLTDLASGRLRRTSDAEITLFKSVGLAVQDLAIAQRAAAAAGIMEAS